MWSERRSVRRSLLSLHLPPFTSSHHSDQECLSIVTGDSGRLTIIHAQNPGCDTLSRKSLTIGRGLADGYRWDTEWWDRNISQGGPVLSCQYLLIFLTTACWLQLASPATTATCRIYIWKGKKSTTDELIILDIVTATNEIVMKTFTCQDSLPLLPRSLLTLIQFLHNSPLTIQTTICIVIYYTN